MQAAEWTLEGREFIHCNCAYGCPCQFNALPTHGDCHAIGAIHVDSGRHGEVRLDGLNFGMVVRWPGAIHEGNGEVQPFVDERASPEQRQALLRIMTGEDTDPGATFFQVFATTYTTVHDPVFVPLEVDIDVPARRARVRVPGLVESRGEPIVNPVTGAEHRANIQLPQGFEYDVCEVGRGWTRTEAPVALSIEDTHAHFARLNMTGHGVAHRQAA